MPYLSHYFKGCMVFEESLLCAQSIHVPWLSHLNITAQPRPFQLKSANIHTWAYWSFYLFCLFQCMHSESHSYNDTIQSFCMMQLHSREASLHFLIARKLSGKTPWGAEPRIELGPALQQASTLLTELRCTHHCYASPKTELRCTLTELCCTLDWATLHPKLSYAAP